jgi:DNA-binding response OmpR family regulator
MLSTAILRSALVEQALDILGEFKPDLVILDFAMPESNGAEIALAIRQRRPDVPVIFISGFADTDLLTQAAAQAPILHKPFRPAQLAAQIRSILVKHPSKNG